MAHREINFDTEVAAIRDQLLSSTAIGFSAQQVPSFSPLPADVHTFWIAEVATAISTLYLGYKLGEEIEDVGQALAYTITQIGNLAGAIAKVIDKLADVIDAINKLTEVLGRRIDESDFRRYNNEMQSNAILLSDSLDQLNKLPRDINDPNVQLELSNIDNLRNKVFVAITGYMDVGQTLRLPEAIISCAAPAALIAQAFTVRQFYSPVEQRVSVRTTRAHKVLQNSFDEFFLQFISLRDAYRSELTTTYVAPKVGSVVEFNGRIFVEYKGGMKKNLYTRNSFNPFNYYGSHFDIGDGVFGKWKWLPVTESNFGEFPDPNSVRDAYQWHLSIQDPIRVRHAFIFGTDNFEELRKKAADGFDGL